MNSFNRLNAFFADPRNLKLAPLAGLLVMQVMALGLALAEPGESFVAAAVIFFLATLAILCERGIVRSIRFTGFREVPGFVYLPVPAILTWMLVGLPAPTWFPTATPYWIVVPWGLFLAVAFTRGWFEVRKAMPAAELAARNEARERAFESANAGRPYLRWGLVAGLAAFQLAVLAWVLAHGPGDDAGPLTLAIAASLIALGVFCEMGLLRMSSGRGFKEISAQMFLLIPFYLLTLTVGLPTPAWYPTDSILWVSVPLVAFFLLSLLRRWDDLGEFG